MQSRPVASTGLLCGVAVQAMSAIAASRGGFIGVLVDEEVVEWPGVRAEEQGF